MATQSDVKIFAYEAQTVEGQRFKGTLEAATPAEVQVRLGELQLRVMSVEAAPPASGKARAVLGADEFLIFNQQLAHLTEAGLPVERGLRLIAADMRSGRLSRAAEEVARDLEAGTPLQDAFTRHAAQFPPLYGKLVEAGASAGNLPGILFNLGRHLELVGRLRRSLWRTLSYPLMVLAALSLVLLFVSLYVMPSFRDIFKDFRTTLPALTEFFMAFADVYPTIFVVLWVAIAAVAVYLVVVDRAGMHGVLWEGFLIRIPVIGGVLRANLLARWIDALRLGIEAGLDLPRALSLAADTSGGYGLAREAKDLSDLIARGEPFTAFRGNIIPATVPAAIELASGAGDVPSVLATLTRMYQEQAETRLRMLPSVLTPILMIGVAGVISLCVTAMFLPLVKLIQSVSGGN